MIEWYEGLITDDYVSESVDEIVCKIINREIMHNIYCICLPSNDKNLLDIINANEFKFPHYDKITTKVLGICKGKDNAVNIVKNLVEDVYKSTGSYDLKMFFTNKEFRR